MEYEQQQDVWEALYEGCSEVDHLRNIIEAEENDQSSIDFASKVFAQMNAKIDPQNRNSKDKRRRQYNKLIKKFKGNFEKYMEPL
eukprot:658336-Rhodomonas_salina.1